MRQGGIGKEGTQLIQTRVAGCDFSGCEYGVQGAVSCMSRVSTIVSSDWSRGSERSGNRQFVGVGVR